MRRFYAMFGKRLLDVVLAGALLLTLAPALAALALVVRWRFGSPVLFRQVRSGLNGRRFAIVKFRSMTNATDESGNLRADEERLTRFGQFLRSTSLDELPELINVLHGEMSLVGPRPLLVSYVDRYT